MCPRQRHGSIGREAVDYEALAGDGGNRSDRARDVSLFIMSQDDHGEAHARSPAVVTRASEASAAAWRAIDPAGPLSDRQPCPSVRSLPFRGSSSPVRTGPY